MVSCDVKGFWCGCVLAETRCPLGTAWRVCLRPRRAMSREDLCATSARCKRASPLNGYSFIPPFQGVARGDYAIRFDLIWLLTVRPGVSYRFHFLWNILDSCPMHSSNRSLA